MAGEQGVVQHGGGGQGDGVVAGDVVGGWLHGDEWLSLDRLYLRGILVINCPVKHRAGEHSPGSAGKVVILAIQVIFS